MGDYNINPFKIVTYHTMSELLIKGDVRKKRGRKPNGGKIITKQPDIPSCTNFQPIVILHLKCRIPDLTISGCNSTYEPYYTDRAYKTISEECARPISDTSGAMDDGMELINTKLCELEYNLHTNTINDKKSACFHCTYPFDNTQFYIPRSYCESVYKVYGCFCSPECAVSYLFMEHMDTSVKFDRYAMLNHMYGSSTNYMNNIKPAPNPYYTLSKFYGNLTIQEYRALLKTNRVLLLVDKPISRCMPELYEDLDHTMPQSNVMYSNHGSANISVKYKNLDFMNMASHK
jgi:hypothetical protein